MKFLCMCQGGNVRSVGLAYVLKYGQGFNQDALACSWQTNSTETLDMLFKWADYIIVMEAYMVRYVPKEYHLKLRVVDVGPDRYGYATNPELTGPLSKIVEEWKAKEWKI